LEERVLAELPERPLAELAARFAEMDVETSALPGGRTLRGKLRLSLEPFPTIAGATRFESVAFSTVGATHIKCLAPLPFFFLPMIALGGCGSASELEARVRAAWTARERNLRMAAHRLDALGVEYTPESGAQVLAFSLGHEDSLAAARAIDPQRIVLPGRGALASLRCTSPEQRIARLDAAWGDASDAELALSQRLDRLRDRLAAAPAPLIVPVRVMPQRLARPPEATRQPRSGARVLLVGPHLGRNAALARRLEQAGLRVRSEFTAHDALDAFRAHSYELVFADTHIGRSEGIELISDLHALPGVGELPVVLVDDHVREAVRDAARGVGASGYLVHPLDPEKVTPGALRLLSSRAKRRFDRLDWRLGVRLADGRGAFTTSVARLGAFIGASWRDPLDEIRHFQIDLPELGRTLSVEAEAVYRFDAVGARGAGVGVLFRGFGERDEADWINYLTELFGSPIARGTSDAT
jgi:two-component system chemotaxis response regulator CheY